MPNSFQRPAVSHGTARIGLIVPPSNTVNEREFAAFPTAGASFHTTRMPLHLDSSPPDYRDRVFADLDHACSLLAPCRPDIVAYACTAGSILMPDEELCARIGGMCGCPAITAAGAIVEALRFLSASRIAIATPYEDALNELERAHFESLGFSVAAIRGLGIPVVAPALYAICEVASDDLLSHVRRTLDASGPVDAIHISCTDLPTFNVIARIEETFGVPVVSSNQAVLWRCCKALGMAFPEAAPGRLMGDR